MAINISTITLNAAPSKVWEALTKPELVKLWQYGSDLITTWQVGSEIRFRTEWQGTVFEQWGTILEFKPYEIIKYSLFAPRPGLVDNPENYFFMSYILSKSNDNTKLIIKHEDYRPNAKQEEPQGEENPILQALKSVLSEIS
jgi:uncharacterized protein YndB with AHSA1/START domain